MKTMKGKIMEYVERNDINGLAEFARAMVEDEIEERRKLLEDILEPCDEPSCDCCMQVREIINLIKPNE